MNLSHSDTPAPNAKNTTSPKKTLRRNIISLAVIQALACGSTALYAADITVNSSSDATAIDSNCTLREAIQAANTNVSVDACTAGSASDVINFDNNLSGSKITLAGTELLIQNNMTIDGDIDNDGVPDIEVNADNLSRVFTITPNELTPSFTLEGLKISGGNAGSGGGVSCQGDFTKYCNLTISNSVITGNTANYGGGGIRAAEYSDLVLTNSTVSNNYASETGGGIAVEGEYSSFTMTNSTISGNTAAYSGAGIHSKYTDLSVDGSTISGNTASYGGGGGITNKYGNTNISNSATISGNKANYSGGGIYTEGGDVTLNNSTITGNESVDGDGGAIYSQDGAIGLTDSTISNNTAYYSGGGINDNHGTINADNSTISGNVATNGSGGGVNTRYGGITLNDSTVSGNEADSRGGGISASGEYGSAISITNSTVSGNTATYVGGGIYTYDADFTLTNSTISGNAANTGGGIFSRNETSYNTITISNSTIVSNTSVYSGGGLYSNYAPGAFNITNTILANNTGGDCVASNTFTANTDDGNLINGVASDCGLLPDVTADPDLGSLAFNGGPTKTHLPNTGSPVIDAGNDPACETTDQRGEARGADACDIGAVEGTVAIASPASVQFDTTTISVSEDGSTVTLNLTRSGDTVSAISVDYTTVDGTATTPGDYTADANTLDFATGVTTQSITIGITDDSDIESDETFSLTLSNVKLVTGAVPVTLGSNASTTVTITDDDAPADGGSTTTTTSSSGSSALSPWWSLLMLTSWLRRKFKS